MTTRPLQRVAGVGLVLGLWLALLAGVMLGTGAAPAAVVLFPSEGFLAGLPAETAIVGRTGFSITLRNPGAGFARALYQAGARVVLPAGLTGCLALQSP